MLAAVAFALGALQQPAAWSRRACVFAAPAALIAPLAARATENGAGALGATCLGFGCNSYGGLDYNGLPASDAPAGSLPYPEFLKALKDKKVEGVVFQPPAGDEAYAIIDGKSVRIGEGWPVEISNSWSSPQWVVRILQNEGVPYAWNFDLKVKPKARTSGSYEPYVPTYSKGITNLDTTNYKTGEAFKGQPVMYGGADAVMATSKP